MKVLNLILLFFIFCITISAQNLEKADVDSLVSLYNEQEKYDSTSLLLVNFAHQEQRKGNLSLALEYQINNCELIEKHATFFGSRGFTLKDFYNNYGMVLVLQRDLNRSSDAIKTYLGLARIIKQFSPNDLPFYTDLIASTIGLCKEKSLADSVYCLQDALDIIKSQEVTKENIGKYLWFCRCFNANRRFNSFENNNLTNNKIDEIEGWYSHNIGFIQDLDTALYRKEILEYLFDYTELLYLYAGAVGTEKRDPLGAIALLNKEISALSSIGIKDELIFLKTASCYAKIAFFYYLLGDGSIGKEYCDKVYHNIFYLKDNLECCNILNILAFMYGSNNQYDLAAKFSLAEIKMRERLGEPVSLNDWASYFLYIVDSDPAEVIKQNNILCSNGKFKNGNSHYYQIIGRAYSMLMNTNKGYQYTAECYFHKADSSLFVNSSFYDKIDQKDFTIGNLYEEWAQHFSRLGQREKSYEYAKKALAHYPNNSYKSYYSIALKSSFLHDTTAIHTYLPRYYYGREEEICRMLPVLGSVESDAYLGNGKTSLYHIPEWASWNPTDSISVRIAYDAALLMKGITLRYNVLTPYYEKHPEMVNAKLELDKMQDSIYSIKDENARLMALHKYQIKEREILKEVNHEQTNVHWEDISHALKDNEACIEFVKYTKNAYNWSDGLPTNHYAALVLCPNTSTPIFVDLFDEDELIDVYNLQPKSYDNEMGVSLYSKLWGNLAKYIEKKDRVYFSPMGLLNLINIENLVDSIGRSAIERFNLYRVSSTRNIIEKKDYVGISSVASFGGIDYKESNEYAEFKNSMNTRGNWAFLQNTLSEVTHIKESLNCNGIKVYTFIGSDATENAFKDLDGTQSNIIHLATHGYYIPQSNRKSIPYFVNSNNTKNTQDELFYSGIVLSGGQKAWINSSFEPNSNDGILSSYEISKLDFHNVDLVVLSACESGLGDNLYDGIYGLQRAFKKAGVRSILMSLWQIDDKATSEYMDIFYKKLSEGSTIHDAYTSTVLEMKHRYPDPYYWASFIMLD